MGNEATILSALADYVIDGESAALARACDAVRSSTDLDPARLLAGLSALKGKRADNERLHRAEVQLRAALQLPLRGGAPCRAGPPE